jgi:ELWxxDGT repeat protein
MKPIWKPFSQPPNQTPKKTAALWTVFLLAAPFFAQNASAQKLLKNITPDQSSPGDSSPFHFSQASPFGYFWAGDLADFGLWRTDGSGKGTIRLLLQRGSRQSKGKPSGLGWKNLFFFQGFDPNSGWELFRTDGSIQGTRLLKDLDPRTKPGGSPSPLSSEPRQFMLSGKGLFFVADTSKGETLFKTDGTAKGTIPLFSIQGSIKNLTPFGKGVVFFAAGTGFQSGGLAISDGTPLGTKVFSKPLSFDSGRGDRAMAVLGTHFFFAAQTLLPPSGKELFVSDGTAAGTKLLKDLWTGSQDSSPKDFETVGNKIFFSAEDPKHGRELWVSDGTVQGTKLFKDLEPLKIQGSPLSGNPTKLKAFGTKLIFQAETQKEGKEPWISDGTPQGTRILKDLQPGPAPSLPSLFLPIGSKVFFVVPSQTRKRILYQTDGRTTQRILGLGTSPYPAPALELSPLGNRILFANWQEKTGLEPWISDGTTQGTQLLKDLVPNHFQPRSSSPRGFTALGEKVYFSTLISGTPNHLWETDATTTGTRPLVPLEKGARIQRAGNRILWVERNSLPRKLLAYDPSLRKLIPLLSSSDSLSALYPLGEKWLFFQHDALKGDRVWVSDGTQTGTRVLSWIPRFPRGQMSRALPFGRKALFFGPLNQVFSSKTIYLFQTDGSRAGTKILKTFALPKAIQTLDRLSFTLHGKELFFSFALQLQGNQYQTLLLKTDGSPKGTKVLRVFPSAQNLGLVSQGSKVLFHAWESVHGSELWISNGTVPGTKLLKDILPGSQSSFPQGLTRLGNKVVFSASTPAAGREVFISDGTTRGTLLLKDVFPGTKSGLHPWPSFVRVGSRRLAFLGEDGTGKRFWVTDGTAQGTRALSSNLPDSGFNPFLEQARFVRGRLFFSWIELIRGKEPWVWFPGASARAYGLGCGSEPSLRAEDPVLGGTMRLAGSFDPKQPAGILLLGSTAIQPQRAGQGCWLYVDPFRLMIPVPIQATQGQWKLTFPLPSQPSLSGLLFQGQSLHPLRAGGFDLSNPVEFAFGR